MFYCTVGLIQLYLDEKFSLKQSQGSLGKTVASLMWVLFFIGFLWRKCCLFDSYVCIVWPEHWACLLNWVLKCTKLEWLIILRPMHCLLGLSLYGHCLIVLCLDSHWLVFLALVALWLRFPLWSMWTSSFSIHILIDYHKYWLVVLFWFLYSLMWWFVGRS